MCKLQIKRFKMSFFRILKEFRNEQDNLLVKIDPLRKSTGGHFLVEFIKIYGVKR